VARGEGARSKRYDSCTSAKGAGADWVAARITAARAIPDSWSSEATIAVLAHGRPRSTILPPGAGEDGVDALEVVIYGFRYMGC
jgi:hypothetical protein